jgi:hypothetical protein
MDAQAKEIKNKVMCEINLLLFFFFLMIDSLIKQQKWLLQSSHLTFYLTSPPGL